MGPIMQIALPSSDVARSVAFYRDTLGLPLLFEVSGMAFFDVHGTRLLIGPPETPESLPSNSALYFDTSDMGGTAARLEENGVTFLGAPEVVQRTEAGALGLHFFRDPDGNLLALMGMVAAD
jgi:catechol 2,3-dioxygenase-like lactoylglutathione lyase family enzyme